MERVLVSRQPIYRRDMTEFGYELLFRDSTENRAEFSDPAQATAEVIVNAFMEIGLEEIVGQRFAFINFDRNLILGNYCDSLPHERVVLEILETVKPDAAVLKKLHHLRGLHYRIALDDYTLQKSSQGLLEIANFVKLDLLASDMATLERSLAAIRKYPVEVIAEKVETLEHSNDARRSASTFFRASSSAYLKSLKAGGSQSNGLPRSA